MEKGNKTPEKKSKKITIDEIDILLDEDDFNKISQKNRKWIFNKQKNKIISNRGEELNKFIFRNNTTKFIVAYENQNKYDQRWHNVHYLWKKTEHVELEQNLYWHVVDTMTNGEFYVMQCVNDFCYISIRDIKKVTSKINNVYPEWILLNENIINKHTNKLMSCYLIDSYDKYKNTILKIVHLNGNKLDNLTSNLKIIFTDDKSELLYESRTTSIDETKKDFLIIANKYYKILNSFDGCISAKGCNNGQTKNKYWKVENSHKKSHYVMHCDKNTYFFFSEELLELVTNMYHIGTKKSSSPTWSESRGDIQISSYYNEKTKKNNAKITMHNYLLQEYYKKPTDGYTLCHKNDNNNDFTLDNLILQNKDKAIHTLRNQRGSSYNKLPESFDQLTDIPKYISLCLSKHHFKIDEHPAITILEEKKEITKNTKWCSCIDLYYTLNEKLQQSKKQLEIYNAFLSETKPKYKNVDIKEICTIDLKERDYFSSAILHYN